MARRIRTEPFTIHLTKPQIEALRIAAKAEHLPMEYVAGDVVKRWLEKQADRATRHAAKQVEQQVGSQCQSGGPTCTRISMAETARMIRKQLVKVFPATRFRVKSNRSAEGGPEIGVFWLAGPEQEVVDKLLEGFGTDREAWLLPDGSAVSTGYDNSQPHPEAIKVRFEPEAVVGIRNIGNLRRQQ